MSEKYVVTWDMLQIHARKLAARLMPSEQWKGIIARQPWRSGTGGAAGT